MSKFVNISIVNRTGFIRLDRPGALNSLSLEMIRTITHALRQWRAEHTVESVVIHSANERAFCAGGDIRFFYDKGLATPRGGSALLEDFFTEEYALNHLIHYYPKLYLAVMDGVVMGGGMGIAQGGESCRLRIVTERTKMAMPEVNIGLFPDVGGSYFLSRAPGQIGTYLALTGDVIGAADALYAGLADIFVPSAYLEAFLAMVTATPAERLRSAVENFAAPLLREMHYADSRLDCQRSVIDHIFSQSSLSTMQDLLEEDASPFAQRTLALMHQRSPLALCVTLEQLRRGALMSVADCLRMERTMVRRFFEYGEVLEGIRALAIDKDNAPQWSPATIEQVRPEIVFNFFAPAWPDYAHPLRDLQAF